MSIEIEQKFILVTTDFQKRFFWFNYRRDEINILMMAFSAGPIGMG